MNQRPIAVLCLAAAALVLQACSGASNSDLLSAAQTFIDKKDYKSAVIQLKTVLQKQPNSGEARLLLGKALAAQGDAAGAVLELRKARESQITDERVVPDLARAMLQTGEHGKLAFMFGDLKLGDAAMADLNTSLATAHMLSNDAAKADDRLRAALQAQPGYAPAVTLQARIKAADGDIPGALAQADSVLGAEPGNVGAGLLKAEILRSAKGDLPGALQVYRQVLAAHPESVAAHSGVLGVLLRQNLKDEAKTQLSALQQVAPQHPETLFYAAHLAFADGDYKQSRDITDRLLKGLPDNVPVLELAGAVEYRQKNYVQAEAFLVRALKIAPGQKLSRHLLAQTYLRGGEPEKAVQTLQPMVERGPADATSLQLLGEAYLQMGDAKRSEAAFQLAAKAAPADPRVRTSVAIAKLSKGEGSAEAIATLESVASEDKGIRADLALISARLSQKDVDGALKAVDALQKKQPDKPLADSLRGRIRLLQRDPTAAAASFEAALQKDPVFFPAVASLAAIDLAAAKPDLAKQRLEAFLKANPKSFQAMLALAELAARTGAPPAEVAQLIARAVKINPSEPRPHLLLVRSQLAAGDSKAALEAAQAAVAALPLNNEVQEILGQALLVSGDSQQAGSTFRKLAALQPKRAQHQIHLAEAQVAGKDLEGAARSLRRAVELEPKSVMAKRRLAGVLLLDNQADKAEAIARELQKSDPKDPAGHALAGDIDMQRKRWDSAATAYKAALQRTATTDFAIKTHQALTAAGKKVDADRLAAGWLKEHARDAVFEYYLGDVALAQRDLPAAETHYRAVLNIQPKNALALNNVAWLMVKQSKPGAVALATQANELAPNQAPLLDTLATALAAEGKLPQAIDAQKKAIARSPKDPALKLNLAKIYIQAGEKPSAKTALDELAVLGDKYAGQGEVQELLQKVR